MEPEDLTGLRSTCYRFLVGQSVGFATEAVTSGTQFPEHRYPEYL